MDKNKAAMMSFDEKSEWFHKWIEEVPKAIEHLAAEHGWPEDTVKETFNEKWESFTDEVVWCYFYMENEMPDTPMNTAYRYYIGKQAKQNSNLNKK